MQKTKKESARREEYKARQDKGCKQIYRANSFTSTIHPGCGKTRQYKTNYDKTKKHDVNSLTSDCLSSPLPA